MPPSESETDLPTERYGSEGKGQKGQISNGMIPMASYL